VTAWKDGNKYLKGESVMCTAEMTTKIEQLKELEALIREAEKEVEALKDEIKAEMTKQNTEEMNAGRYTVRWTSVVSNRFDSTAFKKEMAELYGRYVKQTESRRFSIVG
jgi:predicted phage-related endonuclease